MHGVRDPQVPREIPQVAAVGSAVGVATDERQPQVGPAGTQDGHRTQERIGPLGKTKPADEPDHRAVRRQSEFGAHRLAVARRFRVRDAVEHGHQTRRRQARREQPFAHRLAHRNHPGETT